MQNVCKPYKDNDYMKQMRVDKHKKKSFNRARLNVDHKRLLFVEEVYSSSTNQE